MHILIQSIHIPIVRFQSPKNGTYSVQICKHSSTGNAGTMDNTWALVKLWVLRLLWMGES